MRPASLPERLLLVALGDVPARQLADVAHGIRQVMGIPSRAGPSLDRPGYAYNEARGQYHATSILRRLAGLRAQAGGAPVLGVLAGDLFLPDAAYVLGEADRDGGAALVSTHRLSGEPQLLRRRTQVEAVHVLGQLLGLSDCLDYRCVMFSSRDAADADRKGLALCGGCRVALGLTGGVPA
ncbi:MAG: peptidase M54 [Anaeromyxobacter sp.]